jgi:hypothetical protein
MANSYTLTVFYGRDITLSRILWPLRSRGLTNSRSEASASKAGRNRIWKEWLNTAMSKGSMTSSREL